MEKSSKARKISYLIILPFLVLLVSAFSLVPANAAQVAFTVEKLTVDGKFIVEPTFVTISGSKSAADITIALLQAKFPDVEAYGYNGSGRYFYMSGIYDPDKGGLLSEKDENPLSGWMATVNNSFINTSAGINYPSNGDVLRWQYTIDMGDVGTDPNILGESKLPSKDALIWKIAEINAAGSKDSYGEAYDNAMTVLTDLAATSGGIAAALAALNAEPDDKVTIPDDKVTVVTLNANGGAIILSDGSVSSLEMRFTPDTPVNERAFPTNVVREATDTAEYEFLGWFDTAGNVKYDGYTDDMSETLTLYAKWLAKEKTETPKPSEPDEPKVDPSDPEKPVVTVTVKPEISGGVGTITIPKDTLSNLIDEAVKDAEGAVEPTIVIQMEETGGSVKTVHVNISVAALKEVKESDAAMNVTLASSVGEVTLNKAAIADIVDEAGSADSVDVAIEEEPDEVTSAQETVLSGEKVRAVYDVSLYVDEKKLENFQTTGKLTIGLPYTLKDGETSGSVLVRYVGEDGSTEAMTDGRRYDDAKQLAVFNTKHLSVYAVTYEPVSDGGCDAGFGGGAAVMLSAALGLCLRKKNKR